MNKLFNLVFILTIIGCCPTNNIRCISKAKVEERLGFNNGIDTFYSQSNPLNGTYKIKQGLSKNYVISNFKDGIQHGNRKVYRKGLLYLEEEFLNGLRNGESIIYNTSGAKKSSTYYKNGFPNGLFVMYGDSDSDTLRNAIYVSDAKEMKVYVDTYSDMVFNRTIDLMIFIDPCMIDSDYYKQYFYLKEDSTLIYKNSWQRIDSCFHTNNFYNCL